MVNILHHLHLAVVLLARRASTVLLVLLLVFRAVLGNIVRRVLAVALCVLPVNTAQQARPQVAQLVQPANTWVPVEIPSV